MSTKLGQSLEKEINENAEIFKFSIIHFYENLPKVGVLALISFLSTLFLVFLLRYIASIMVVVILLVSSIGSITLTVFLWLKYIEISKINSEIMMLIPFTGIHLKTSELYLIYAIIVTSLTVN